VNPRQRRGILLILLSLIGAGAVFLLVVNYVGEVNSRVGPSTQVLQLNTDLAPFTAVTPEMVVSVAVPARWGPIQALQSPVELGGRVSTVPLPAGTILQEGMLVVPPQIVPGEREIAILVDAETGVAGRISSGSVVDIFATFAADDTSPAQSAIVIEAAEIVNVGVATASQSQNADGGFSQGAVVPITFALSVQEAEQLVYVEEFASSLRLALRAPTDQTQLGLEERIYQPRRDGNNLDELLAPSDDGTDGVTPPALPGIGDSGSGTGGLPPPPVPGGGG
jgi:Flp pilus assembly protein CpaB